MFSHCRAQKSRASFSIVLVRSILRAKQSGNRRVHDVFYV